MVIKLSLALKDTSQCLLFFKNVLLNQDATSQIFDTVLTHTGFIGSFVLVSFVPAFSSCGRIISVKSLLILQYA